MNTDEINVLLERAGCKKIPNTIRVWNFSSRRGSGKQVESLQNTLILSEQHRQALAAALKKVLDERDAAINCLQDESNCAGCKWDSEYNDPESPCLFCKRGWEDETEDYYVWRGPQPKEDSR